MNLLTRLRNLIAPPVRPLDLRQHCLPLDGVRGLAILLVFCYDCLRIPNDGSLFAVLIRKASTSGWTGVDLFFVLSGFLITGILLDTRGLKGYWKSFLLRRSVRIFPLYYGTLIAVFLGVPLLELGGFLIFPEGLPGHLQQNQVWFWFYGQNWLLASYGDWPADRLLNHFWSLAVEEQFYLIWPLIVAALNRKWLKWFCLGSCVFALALRTFLLWNDVPNIVPYVMTITRLDSLCFGGLLAIGLRNPAWRIRWSRWFFPGFLVAGLTVLGVDVVYPILQSQSFGAYSLGHTAVGLTFVLLIATAVSVNESHPLARVFSLSPLVHLGKYSYAIYVFHRFVYQAVLKLDWTGFPSSLQPWLIFFTTLAGSLVVAQISWRLLERPMLNLKRHFPQPVAEETSAENTMARVAVQEEVSLQHEGIKGAGV